MTDGAAGLAGPQHPRTVIVTGAATGIGEGVARAFAAEGAHLVLADLDGEGLERLATGLRESAASVDAMAVDVTDTAAIEDVTQRARSHQGRVDVLVTAAGGHGGAVAADEVSDEAWDRLIALNLTSSFKAARAVMPAMKQARAGRIVMISSATGRMPTTTASSAIHYAAAKAGVIGVVRQLAVELGPFGVTVNAVAPGTTLTDRVRRIRSMESLAGITAAIPLGRVATVEDQVGPIVFLASTAAQYLTGVVLDVNGGRIMA